MVEKICRDDVGIIKEAIIGYCIVKGRTQIFHHPISSPYDMDIGMEEYDLDERDEVLGIIPANPGSFIVSGYVDNGVLVMLGYEHVGAECPDWRRRYLGKTKFEREVE